MALLEQGPVILQLHLMEFRPCLDKTLLTFGQRSRDKPNGINAEDTHCILIIGVEMRNMMRASDLGKHTNNNTKKPAKFRHSIQLS